MPDFRIISAFFKNPNVSNFIIIGAGMFLVIGGLAALSHHYTLNGMSFLALDTKGDLARNYGTIAKKYYGYHVSVIDLRNPTHSDGNNFLTLINRYMDMAQNDPKNLAARAKAEKYAKILSKTIINPEGEGGNRGQNAFFYDAAEGLLTSVILLLAEFLPPDEQHPQERRHIVSVFKLVQDLLEPSKIQNMSHFQILMSKLPPDHKAKWFAGAALNSSEQAMASVMSTVLCVRWRIWILQ